MTELVYIGIGSNIGNRIQNCQQALITLVECTGGSLRRRSSWYQTQPWGREDQEDFVNGAAEIEMAVSPRQLLKACQEIERLMGRRDSIRWGPRIIDLDILLYGDCIVRSPDLEIPHPRLHLRNFVLIPLEEIAPDLLHPVFKKTIHTLCSGVTDRKQVLKIME
ncbi:MAG TPA: 2-amino-4-hydroxy-6-hydroxymethyldihydropteridine diphosphokinase [Thermodesulfobacteriota bacterium]|nr:2-amino-4-hydroxy-6-hydroxymethyldihydropteridine diphosphokinase [Deltaproteobacteria bacterium]HNR13276.1 2-amino-4-hydroxy-6-hydroxymethyldihydropteridine diphosphokinase [Thermodesulfobacteriota bacterium]HNU70637.1 2-amino-4-hydroxy-6-hydroxymethyldihydropteridine diphosphokinase [Thermodesulfobacteriota bacterium]HQO77228.1 2-amino-4-hydroxy-6-hydroxymethyldihydropteridine diphosphokinase [Thermodesulfobacteriota bacterium]